MKVDIISAEGCAHMSRGTVTQHPEQSRKFLACRCYFTTGECRGICLLQIENQKLEFKAQSKVGSLANVKYKPGGGDVKIFDDKMYLKQISGGASSIASSEDDRVSGTQVTSFTACMS